MQGQTLGQVPAKIKWRQKTCSGRFIAIHYLQHNIVQQWSISLILFCSSMTLISLSHLPTSPFVKLKIYCAGFFLPSSFDIPSNGHIVPDNKLFFPWLIFQHIWWQYCITVITPIYICAEIFTIVYIFHFFRSSCSVTHKCSYHSNFFW